MSRNVLIPRIWRLAALAAALAVVLIQPATAARTHHLHGGGTATISQVAMNVRIADNGTASGSFECLMAGRSAFVLPAFGLRHIMAVHAWPNHGTIEWPVVRFSGPGRLNMDNGQHLQIDVAVWANVVTQTFQLQVVQVGTLPVETMVTGRIALH